MQLNQNLNIKHSQSIVMTPQLRQAIKLLQFSNLELSSYIEEEIEKNPFLENKSYEGSGAFLIASFLCIFIPFHFVVGLTVGKNIMFSLIWSLLITAFEALPSRVDDNLTIPLVTATIGWIIASLWSIPLSV